MDVPHEDILINQANIQWFQLVWFKNVAYVLCFILSLTLNLWGFSLLEYQNKQFEDAVLCSWILVLIIFFNGGINLGFLVPEFWLMTLAAEL